MADLLSDVLVGVEHLTGYVERHSVRVMADDRASLAGGSPFDAPGDDAAEGRIASVLPTASASNDPTEPIAVPPIAVPPAAPASRLGHRRVAVTWSPRSRVCPGQTTPLCVGLAGWGAVGFGFRLE